MEALNMTANQLFRAAFLDFFNNYLTIEKYAEDNGISIEDATNLVDAGRKYHEQHVKLCRQAEGTK